MTGTCRKFILGAALAATALTSASPAMADPYGRHRRHAGGDAVGAAVLGGIIGLAIGVIAASAAKKRERCETYPDQERYRGSARRDNRDGRCEWREDTSYRDDPQQDGYRGDFPQQEETYQPGDQNEADQDNGYGYGDADRGDDESGAIENN